MDAASRRLVILRHAKSAWPDGVPDELRPLGGRGRRDAPAVGRWLRGRVAPIGAVVCSPALRTRQTWELVAGELGDTPEPVFDERVYAASADELLTVVRELPDGAAAAVLVGHNPGVENLVELLTTRSAPMLTSSVALLDLPGGWADAAAGAATLVEHATVRG